jgi:hypothetical protein
VTAWRAVFFVCLTGNIDDFEKTGHAASTYSLGYYKLAVKVQGYLARMFHSVAKKETHLWFIFVLL